MVDNLGMTDLTNTIPFMSISDMVNECCEYFFVPPKRLPNKKYAQTLMRKRINEIKADYEREHMPLTWLRDKYEVRQDFFDRVILEDPVIVQYYIKHSDTPNAANVPEMKKEMLRKVQEYLDDPPTFDNTPYPTRYSDKISTELCVKQTLDAVLEIKNRQDQIEEQVDEILRFVRLLSSNLLGFGLKQYDKDKESTEELVDYLTSINFTHTVEYAGYSVENNDISSRDLLLYNRLMALYDKLKDLDNYAYTKVVEDK